ncbi:MAG: MerR family transcriptional regulator [Bdellovibrionota bacterium]
MTKTTTTTTNSPIQIPDRLYFRIGDVAELIGVKPYVLRYWESEFPMISPQKSNTGQRVYRRSDVETVLMIKHLLYDERYSIEGARKRLKELRREGELKTFKEETVAAHTGASVPSETIAELKEVAKELRTLARTPMSELFRL